MTEEDRGYYLCEAANGVGADLSTVVKLSVHGKCEINELMWKVLAAMPICWIHSDKKYLACNGM